MDIEMPMRQRQAGGTRESIFIQTRTETDTYQMEKARQNHCNESLELQLYDFLEFPNIDTDKYNITVERFVSGEVMKSGKPRPKNAISFKMECDDVHDIHEFVHRFVVGFIENEFSPSLMNSLVCEQAFVRFHLPTQGDREIQDFAISPAIMKVLVDRGIHLDFWFLR